MEVGCEPHQEGPEWARKVTFGEHLKNKRGKAM